MENLYSLLEKNDDKVRLFKKINEFCGFFTYKNNLIFGVKSRISSSANSLSLKTQYLRFNSSVYIRPISENSNFKEGYFDLLTFTGELHGTIYESFMRLCELYASQVNTMKFSSFFESLSYLFKKPKLEDKLDFIGFYGELSLIYKLRKNNGIDISKYWHMSGSNSKYDFNLDKFNLEVKTTTKENLIFRIKNDQVICENKICLSLVRISKDDTDSNLSLSGYVEYFKSHSPFSENLNFQIQLLNELKKCDAINDIEALNCRYLVNDIKFIFVKDMLRITEIPSCITNLVYDYDFNGNNLLKLDDFVRKINE